jgi:hypothetical protein
MFCAQGIWALINGAFFEVVIIPTARISRAWPALQDTAHTKSNSFIGGHFQTFSAQNSRRH